MEPLNKTPRNLFLAKKIPGGLYFMSFMSFMCQPLHIRMQASCRMKTPERAELRRHFTLNQYPTAAEIVIWLEAPNVSVRFDGKILPRP